MRTKVNSLLIFFFTFLSYLSCNAATCPTPETIKPRCSSLVTTAMLKKTMEEKLKGFDFDVLKKTTVLKK